MVSLLVVGLPRLTVPLKFGDNPCMGLYCEKPTNCMPTTTYTDSRDGTWDNYNQSLNGLC